MYFGYGYYFDWYYIPILLAVLCIAAGKAGF